MTEGGIVAALQAGDLPPLNRNDCCARTQHSQLADSPSAAPPPPPPAKKRTPTYGLAIFIASELCTQQLGCVWLAQGPLLVLQNLCFYYVVLVEIFEFQQHQQQSPQTPGTLPFCCCCCLHVPWPPYYPTCEHPHPHRGRGTSA